MNTQPTPAPTIPRLTKTEHAILKLLITGLSSKAIGTELQKTEQAVRTRINMLYKKFNLDKDPTISQRVTLTNLVKASRLAKDYEDGD